MQIDNLRTHLAHDVAQLQGVIPKEVRMRAPTHGDDVHWNAAVGAGFDELPTLAPRWGSHYVNVMTMSLTQ
jgi:hypothetical protein